jgi:hypothetical protein
MKFKPATYCCLCGGRYVGPEDLENNGYGLCVLNSQRTDYFLLAIVCGIIAVGLAVTWKMWS